MKLEFPVSPLRFVTPDQGFFLNSKCCRLTGNLPHEGAREKKENKVSVSDKNPSVQEFPLEKCSCLWDVTSSVRLVRLKASAR